MMKLKAIFVALAVAAAASSAALAAPAKGKPPLTGPGCKPQVSLILKGTVAVAPGVSPSLPFSLKLTVTQANEQGEAYVKASQPITVTVTSDTKIKRKGTSALSALQGSDRVVAHARACAADLAHGATPLLTASKIDAHPAKS